MSWSMAGDDSHPRLRVMLIDAHATAAAPIYDDNDAAAADGD